MRIGGLDIGTTGCKISVYDEAGNFVKCEYAEYEVTRSGGLHEVDPAMIWDGVKRVVKNLDMPDLEAMAVTSFGETFVMLDADDKPCAPSMLYTDPRGREECEKTAERFGREYLAYLTGADPHEMYSLPKIMWIKNNMPAAYKATKRILLMQDYIVYMLTGRAQIDHSLAARTTCFDIKAKKWCDEILDFCGIDKTLFSTPVPSGTIAGNIKIELAKELNVSPYLKVISGCHDQIAAMTGANAYSSDEVMDGTGTVECVPVIMDEPPKDFSLYKCGYSFAPHINGKYACYVLSYCGGSTIKWFKDNFTDKSYDELNRNVKEEPTNLLIMPHFAGAATPYMDTAARAVMAGLTFEHTKTDIYKALMEGTAYEIAVNLDVLANFGVKPKTLIATGGGAKSDVWLQIKADVLNAEVIATDTEEVGAAGTAFLAGAAVGIYDKNTRLVKSRKTFYPNPKRHEFYSLQFKKYKKMYKLCKELYED